MREVDNTDRALLNLLQGKFTGLLSPFTGRGDHCLKHTTVPKMDTVEESCGYYSHFTHSKL